MSRQKQLKWSRLDNAAKIFPPTSNKKDTKVFRFSCQLLEPVDPEILQQALERTLEDYPLFRCILRRGLFWYYFEETDKKPLVTLEHKPPCSRLYFRDSKNLFFEATYYKNRMNLEVHHSLTDGTGALNFLKAFVQYYLTMKHKEALSGETVLSEDDASMAQKEDDSFRTYYQQEGERAKKPREKEKHAFQIKGTTYSENRIRVIEGKLPLGPMLGLCKENQVTLSVYLTALFIWAIGKNMTALHKKRPVVLSVPVNLRNYFDSSSARNFFSVFQASYQFTPDNGSFEDILQSVKLSYEKGLDEERLRDRLDRLSSFEYNLAARMVPLFLKDIVLAVINYFEGKKLTGTISNLGKITMPQPLRKYIDYFSMCISTSRIQIVFCSYEDTLVIGFTSPYINAEVQKEFFRFLSQKGIPVVISANGMNE